MVEYPPDFLTRLKAINRRRMLLVAEARRNYEIDLERIAGTIDGEIEGLHTEFGIEMADEEESQ